MGCRRWVRRAVMLALALGAGWLWLRGSRHTRPRAWHPDAIILHHSATPPVVRGHRIDASAIDSMHQRRGFRAVYRGKVYHIGYHYVVLPDGTVQTGRPEGCVGAHARHVNDHSLGVCLVGNFSSQHNPRGTQGPAVPSETQFRAAVRLCAYLGRKYGIAPGNMRRHGDVGQTACPGDRFPLGRFRQAVRREMMRKASH